MRKSETRIVADLLCILKYLFYLRVFINSN